MFGFSFPAATLLLSLVFPQHCNYLPIPFKTTAVTHNLKATSQFTLLPANSLLSHVLPLLASISSGPLSPKILAFGLILFPLPALLHLTESFEC